MKKIFGMEAEFNITADEEIIHGLGKGIQNGSVAVMDIVGTIYVDMNNAPYMPYTNEPWIAHRWGGKKNPNESWWNKTAEALVYEIADFIGGEVIQ